MKRKRRRSWPQKRRRTGRLRLRSCSRSTCTARAAPRKWRDPWEDSKVSTSISNYFRLSLWETEIDPKSSSESAGVDEVKADSRSHTVVVKGKAADPTKICERVQRKTGRKTELVSPLPKPPEEEAKKEEPKEEEKEEVPAITTDQSFLLHHPVYLSKKIQHACGSRSYPKQLFKFILISFFGSNSAAPYGDHGGAEG